MRNVISIKDLCEFIWNLEEKYNLLDYEIDGVKPWQLYRIDIYYQLTKKLSIFESNIQRGLSFKQKVFNGIGLFANAFLHYPFINLKKVDALIIAHPRAKKVDGAYVDIYTYQLKHDLLEQGTTLYEFEKHYLGKHLKEKTELDKYMDYITVFSTIKKRFIQVSLTDEQLKYIKIVQDEIEQKLEFKLDLKNLFINAVKKYKATAPYYKKLLKKTHPKTIYLVVSYGEGILISIAKSMKIPTIELQHGTFSKYHLGYSFPKHNKSLLYFPDKFYVWNDFWKQITKLPISDENVDIYPFKYMEKMVSQYSNVKKVKNKAVVLSQGRIGDQIAKKILDDYENFKHLDIVFKLHPEEYAQYNQYKYLKLLRDKFDIEIVKNVDLYHLLAESEYQIGVFSTAIYEGLEFDCKTILLNLPGIEYMYRLLELRDDIKVL